MAHLGPSIESFKASVNFVPAAGTSDKLVVGGKYGYETPPAPASRAGSSQSSLARGGIAANSAPDLRATSAGAWSVRSAELWNALPPEDHTECWWASKPLLWKKPEHYGGTHRGITANNGFNRSKGWSTFGPSPAGTPAGGVTPVEAFNAEIAEKHAEGRVPWDAHGRWPVQRMDKWTGLRRHDQFRAFRPAAATKTAYRMTDRSFS
jgi:hypothetical protein